MKPTHTPINCHIVCQEAGRIIHVQHKPTHTPTWKVNRELNAVFQYQLRDDSGDLVAQFAFPDDAEYCRRAVNAHDGLLEVLRSTLNKLEGVNGNFDFITEPIIEAIAKAEGK